MKSWEWLVPHALSGHSCVSPGYFGLEHACHWFGLTHKAWLNIILTRPRWIFLLLIALLSGIQIGWLLPLHHTSGALADNVLGMVDIVITWSYSIVSQSSEACLRRFLLDQLPKHVLFVTEDAVMARDWRRIQHSLVLGCLLSVSVVC